MVKVCKHIITLLLALVTCFSLCVTPVLAAWQNDLGYWYVNSSFAQFVVGSGLSIGGTAAGAYFGHPVAGEMVGSALAAGISDLASYYAAGYTDDDYYTAESDYVSTLDRTTAQTGISVGGFTCTNLIQKHRNSAYDYLFAYALTSDSFDDFFSCVKSLGINSKVLVFALTSSYLFGFYWDETGMMRSALFINPYGSEHSSYLGVYSLADLTFYADLSSSSDLYYSKAYAQASENYLTRTLYAMTWLDGRLDRSYPCYQVYKKLSTDSTWLSSTFYLSYPTAFSSEMIAVGWYSTAAVDSITWNSSHTVTQPSGTDATTRTASLMQTINNFNNDNSYTDNSTTVNYFIGSLGDDGSVTDVYSPALYDEETLIFTEPISGTQYQTTGWTYDYTTRSYDLTLAPGTMTVADTDITQVVCTYGDDAVTISFCDSSGTAVQTDEFAYVMASQSECNINGHTYNVETTKEPTCTAAGERTYTCSICGNQYVEEISKTDHTYADYTITQEPTCTAGGIVSYTCSTCGAQITEKLDALGHDWLASEVTETTYSVPEGTSCPSCAGTAFTHTRSGDIYTCTCSDCSTEWSVNAVVTYGSTTYTCSRCGETYVESEDPDSGLFAALANFLSDGITWVTGKFTELAESINSIHTTFRSYLQKIQNVGGDFPALLGAAIGVLPEDFMAVVWFSIVALVILAVWLKFFK